MVGQPGQIRGSQGDLPLWRQRLRPVAQEREPISVAVARTQRQGVLFPQFLLRPRVFRQVHVRDRTVLVETGLTGGVDSTHRIQVRDRLQHRLLIILVTVQGLDRGTGDTVAHKAFSNVPEQDRMRTKLQEHPVPILDEGVDGLREQDAFAHVLEPVVRVCECRAVDLLTGDGRVDRHVRLPGGKACQRSR